MNINKNILLVLIVSFFIILTLNVAFAEEAPAMPEISNGTVSGGVDLVYSNPYVYSGELSYQIPKDSKEITSATVVIDIYSGSGYPTYGLYSNVTLETKNEIKNLGYEKLDFNETTTNDPIVYIINNHTTKQYSDYQMVYDVTGYLNTLNPGDSITIKVNNTEIQNLSFYGKIKVIALIVAYNDFDNDNITYFLNVGQSWVKEGTRSNLFNTKKFIGKYDEVLLQTIALSSTNGLVKFNNNVLLTPISEKIGNYCIYDEWNVTSLFKKDNDNNISYASSPSAPYGSFKENIQLLTIIENDNVNMTVSVTPEYKDTIYAGVNNTLTVTIANNGKNFNNASIVLMEGDKILNSIDQITLINNSISVKIVDPTIRAITENTVLGNNNSKVNYTIIVKDIENKIIKKQNVEYTILYNGNLGKDFEYPQMNGTINREYLITGNIVILNQPVSTYAAGTVTAVNVSWDSINSTSLVEGLLYISYNWDKTTGSEYPIWNVTFNNIKINHIATYRDQSNLGSYGSLGYGLIVYNVTDLIKTGTNDLTINKIGGLTAVYPASLVLLYNNTTAKTIKKVYISENADLLSITNNKNIVTGAYTKFDIDASESINATLYISAASAQIGEGNIIINGENYTNVWSGTSNSVETNKYNIANIKNNNTIFFQATGSTILALQQILVVENEIPNIEISVKPEYTNSIYAGINNTLTTSIKNGGKEYNNATVILMDGEKVLSTINNVNLLTNATTTVSLMDSTIRPITENTVLGKNNSKVNYKIIVKSNSGKVLSNTTTSYTVLYDGYLGKYLEYPQMNSTIIRNYTITGDVVIINQPVSSYMNGNAVNRTDIWNIDNKNLVEGLLYISYNWDKTTGSEYPVWNVTFNNVTIESIASYRDQSNLGSYGSLGYGLIVYNVTGLIKNQNNTLIINKISGLTAVYPSSLVLLYNNESSDVAKLIYISENADLLAKTYNKNIDVNSYTKFNIDSNNVINSTLYVFAASGQKDEGNIVINGKNHNNVWNGTSNSLDYVKFNIANLSDENIINFQATGSTILSLQQILVVEKKLSSTVIVAKDLVKYYKNDTQLEAVLTDIMGNPIANAKLGFIINGIYYNRTTNATGSAIMAIKLPADSYNITIDYKGNGTYDPSSKVVSVTVLPVLLTSNTYLMFQNGTEFIIKVLDGQGNPLAGAKTSSNINGVFYNRTTNANGTARIKINLPANTYIVTTTYNGAISTSNITVYPVIVDNKNFTKYFKNGTQFTFKVLDNHGNALDKAVVTLNINGQMYTRTTNASGIAKMDINLGPGEYIITLMYGNYITSNTVKVLSVIETTDISMPDNARSPFVATILNGQGKPLAKASVTFNINGVMYDRTTNSSGMCKLDINLPLGEYIITTIYNTLQQGNNVTITKV